MDFFKVIVTIPAIDTRKRPVNGVNGAGEDDQILGSGIGGVAAIVLAQNITSWMKALSHCV